MYRVFEPTRPEAIRIFHEAHRGCSGPGLRPEPRPSESPDVGPGSYGDKAEIPYGREVGLFHRRRRWNAESVPGGDRHTEDHPADGWPVHVVRLFAFEERRNRGADYYVGQPKRDLHGFRRQIDAHHSRQR